MKIFYLKRTSQLNRDPQYRDPLFERKSLIKKEILYLIRTFQLNYKKNSLIK